LNWEAVGAVAETLGAAGVIATLVYLVAQIRQNTATVRATGAVARNEGQNNITLILAQDADARRGIQRNLHLHREKAISEEAWQEVVYTMAYLSAQPGFRSAWAKWGPTWSPTARELVDAHLEAQAAPNSSGT
jgi:hypothetical protein